MGKVKKSGKVTDVRRTAKGATKKAAAKQPSRGNAPGKSKAARPAVSKSGGSKRRTSGRTAPAKSARKAGPERTAGKRGRSTAAKGATRKRAPVAKPGPTVEYRARDLNPQEMCGAGTSVERLIRVDQFVDRVRQAHLVYLDHHGWYCEHGTTCPAVGHARKHAKHVRSGHAGNANHNGRMRA